MQRTHYFQSSIFTAMSLLILFGFSSRAEARRHKAIDEETVQEESADDAQIEQAPSRSRRSNRESVAGVRVFAGWGAGLAGQEWTQRNVSPANAGDDGVFGSPGSGLLGGVEGFFAPGTSFEAGLSVIPFTVKNYSFSETYTNTSGTNNRTVTEALNSTAIFLSFYAAHSFGKIRVIGGWGLGYAMGGDDVLVKTSNWSGGLATPGEYKTTITTPVGGSFASRGYLGAEYPIAPSLSLTLGTSLIAANFSALSGGNSVSAATSPIVSTTTTTAITSDASKATAIAVSQQSILLGICFRI